MPGVHNGALWGRMIGVLRGRLIAVLRARMSSGSVICMLAVLLMSAAMMLLVLGGLGAWTIGWIALSPGRVKPVGVGFVLLCLRSIATWGDPGREGRTTPCAG